MTFVLAFAFGADFDGEQDEPGYTQWMERKEERRGSGYLPWSRGGGRKLSEVQEARMRLSDERKRRVEAEKSLSTLRVRMGEVTAENEALTADVQRLEGELAHQSRQLLDLRADVARATAASPELVDRFIDLAEDALRSARFHLSLELLDEARQMLDVLPPAGAPQRSVRLELVRANSHVALGNEAETARSLSRLLAVEPDYVLDVARSSPKLVRAFEELRASQSAIARADVPETADPAPTTPGSHPES